jgi:hypothetical protein
VFVELVELVVVIVFVELVELVVVIVFVELVELVVIGTLGWRTIRIAKASNNMAAKITTIRTLRLNKPHNES